MRIMTGAVLTVLLMASCGSGQKPGNESAKGAESADHSNAAATALDISLESSQVKWKGEMLGVYSHHGTVAIKSASLTVKGDKVTEGEFAIDLTSINPTDDNYSEDRPKENLVGHLSSDDFFDVANHPTATFVITSVDGGTVTGDLTIRGTTHSESFEDVKVVKEGESYSITGKLEFDRKKYDVSWDSSMQDMVLSDKIEITIDLVASA